MVIVANSLDKYIKNVSTSNLKTGKEYHKRLLRFSAFLEKTHKISMDELISTMTTPSQGPKIDVYDLLSEYVSYLHDGSGKISPGVVKSWVNSVRYFLEYWDIEVSPRRFKLRVRMPKAIRQTKEALSKEDIINLINACPNIKLKTFVMFLAATGCRATESLSIKLEDLEFTKGKIFLQGENTKTKTDRYVLLTSELLAQLKAWLDYKYRTRRISYPGRDTIVKTPQRKDDDLLFSANLDENPTIVGLYVVMSTLFDKTLDRLGGKYALYETSRKRRRKITLHSFRRFVKSTISDLGYYDFSEYFIGHSGSTYYRKPEKEKAELFQKIQPYLTFLDFASLERKGADFQTQMELLQAENARLRQREDKLDKDFRIMKAKTDRIDELIGNADRLKKKLK